MKDKQQTDLEKFLRDKLESEISSFGDGMTEFHTRDLNQLINILDSKDQQNSEMQTKIEVLELANKDLADTHNVIVNDLQKDIKNLKLKLSFATPMSLGDANIKELQNEIIKWCEQNKFNVTLQSGHKNNVIDYMCLMAFISDLPKTTADLDGLRELWKKEVQKYSFLDDDEIMVVNEDIAIASFDFFLPHLQKPVESDAVEFAEWCDKQVIYINEQGETDYKELYHIFKPPIQTK